MKEYKKPIIVSEEVFEKTALACEDFAYYDKETTPCYDDYLGTGKENEACAQLYT